MCGIAGIICNDTIGKFSGVDLSAYSNSLARRGPDAEGHYLDEGVVLFHRRLSIIDLSNGVQPMFSADGRYCIVYNGELYNYKEIQRVLVSQGITFKTNSDTEVILNAYIHWGEDCLQKFNGMWAFAIWDKEQRQMFLSRDRIGEKPLYYSQQDDYFIFSSELKFIKAVASPEKEFNYSNLYLALGFLPAPFTFLKNVLKLEAGHFLIVKENNFVKNSYWSLPLVRENDMLRDKHAAVKKFRELLIESIELRLVSDVDVGICLSGGLDSSSILASLHVLGISGIKAFNMGFDEAEIDESHRVKKLVEKFPVDLIQQKFDISKLDISSIVDYFDEPFADISMFPTWQLFNTIRQHSIKVVLTGDGGDEVLSGYTHYLGEKINGIIGKTPSSFQNLILHVLSRNKGGSIGKLKEMINLSRNTFSERLIFKNSKVDYKILKSYLTDASSVSLMDYLDQLFSNLPFEDNFYKLMYFDNVHVLPERMLTKVDRMSMYNGVEARSPFLDYRISEYMACIHKDVKISLFKSKAILREAFKDLLPCSYLNAPKMGFIPDTGWLFDEKYQFEGSEKPLCNISMRSLVSENASYKNIFDLNNFLFRVSVMDKFANKV